MADSEQSTPSILRRKQVEVKIGLSRSTIYDRIDPNSPRYDSTFPKPIKLGGGKNPPIGFIESEVNAWITSQIVKSRSPGAQ